MRPTNGSAQCALRVYNKYIHNADGVNEMARKETIYTVSKETNLIVRVSKSLLSAIEYAATLPAGEVFVCTSEFQGMKKGDPMSNIVDFLA